MATLDTTLDPSITPELVDQAHDRATPVDYDQVFAEITKRLAQDDVDEEAAARALVAPSVRKPREAIAFARQVHEEDLDVGIGFCLREVRTYFDVGPLWPDAETAGEHSQPLHRTSNPLEFPRGSIGYAFNGRHGHVWLNVGGGLCWSTDFRRLGRVDLAPISAMAPWIGGRLIGWGEVLNGVDVWPDPKKPKKLKPLTLQEKLQVVVTRERELRKAGHDKQADRLALWEQTWRKRIKAQK